MPLIIANRGHDGKGILSVSPFIGKNRQKITWQGLWMKKKAEIGVAALAVMFVCFALGYFVGQRSVPSEVTISSSSGTVVITPSTASPSADVQYAAAAESGLPESEPPPEPKTQQPSEEPPPSELKMPTPAASEEPPEQTAPETAEPGESHYTADGKLRINYATQKELETLPGIGEVLASRIIEYREQNGAFSKLSTLKVVKGIGDARYNAIKELITVE